MKPVILMFCCGVVNVVAAVAAAADGPRADSTRGRMIFETWCASCHGAGIGNPGATERPGTAALRAKYNGQLPALLTERTDLTPEVVAVFVRQGVTIMPFFRKSEISDRELADLGAYLSRNSAAQSGP